MDRLAPMSESVLTYGAPGPKLGEGASDEIGYDHNRPDRPAAAILTGSLELG